VGALISAVLLRPLAEGAAVKPLGPLSTARLEEAA
jgi:hypothetical protein